MAKKTIKIENNEAKQDSSAQEKYMELQMLDQQAKQLQKYLQSFDQQLVDIRSVMSSINDFSKLEKGSDILAPIANGVFIKAKLEASHELRVNVGNNVVVTKTIAEAIELLESQEKEIVQYRSETMANLEALMHRLEELQE